MRRALFFSAVEHDLLRLGVVGDSLESVASFRQLFETENLNRHGGSDFLDLLTAIVEHGADAAEDRTADEVIALMESTVADEHGGNGSTAAIEFGFEHARHGGTRGICLQVLNFGDEKDHFQQ
jgi:hypothetical protein